MLALLLFPAACDSSAPSAAAWSCHHCPTYAVPLPPLTEPCARHPLPWWPILFPCATLHPSPTTLYPLHSPPQQIVQPRWSETLPFAGLHWSTAAVPFLGEPHPARRFFQIDGCLTLPSLHLSCRSTYGPPATTTQPSPPTSTTTSEWIHCLIVATMSLGLHLVARRTRCVVLMPTPPTPEHLGHRTSRRCPQYSSGILCRDYAKARCVAPCEMDRLGRFLRWVRPHTALLWTVLVGRIRFAVRIFFHFCLFV
jgi:hypothetical protein